MTPLMQRAELAKVELDIVKAELERVVKDSSNLLLDRFNHLLMLAKLGGAHSDWVFHGWDELEINPIEDMWCDRNYKYDLLDLIHNAIEGHASDELFAEYDRYRFAFIEVPDTSFFDWLVFLKQEPAWVALVEAMCDQAVLTFNYEW